MNSCLEDRSLQVFLHFYDSGTGWKTIENFAMFLPKAFPGSTQLSPDAWSSPNDTHFQQKMLGGTVVLTAQDLMDVHHTHI